ncbi:MAG: UbiA prenyltransferase family protein [Selenomonadaceae bacterium]|nr:UbiA prenyltransferase family protein [Selenomonadaceae bacterium]
MRNYIRIARPDHWIKNIFVIPGIVFAMGLSRETYYVDTIIFNIIVGMISTCLIASANYTINEWLDAPFDRFHPIKKNRPAVSAGVKAKGVYIQYVILLIAGLSTAWAVSIEFASVMAVLAMMGVVYNVEPLRSKDKPFLDVLSESINNPLRLLGGWFMVTNNYLPPVSLLLGYWFGGAFLMAIKRFSEYRMIVEADTEENAALYRKSFGFYNEEIQLNYSFFFALCTVFVLGVFLIKYKIELLIFVPFLAGLFCWYFHISLKADSAAQKPEKLYREKAMMLYVLFLVILFSACMLIDIPLLHPLLDSMLIPL